MLFALEKRNYLNSIYKKAKFFLLKLLLLRSWGLANNLHIYKKIWKTWKTYHYVYFDLRNKTISNLQGQSQSKSLTISLTLWSSKVPKQYDSLCKAWKISENGFYSFVNWNIYYQLPISVTTLLKLKIKQCQLKRWLKRKNHSI